MRTIKEKLKSILEGVTEPFVSEADFQFYLAWELQRHYQDADIILEYPVEKDGKMHYYDIAVKFGNGELVFIELKYKTKKTNIRRYGKEITLKTHGAVPQNKYRFIKDIQRMEQASNNNTNYCVFLTNDSHYWKEAKQNNANLKPQYISSPLEDVICENKSWTERNNNTSQLKNRYDIEWRKLEKLPEGKLFKYLLIEVKKTN